MTPRTARALAREPVVSAPAPLLESAACGCALASVPGAAEPEGVAAPAEALGAPAAGAAAFAAATNASWDFSAVGFKENTMPAAQWSAGVFCLQ